MTGTFTPPPDPITKIMTRKLDQWRGKPTRINISPFYQFAEAIEKYGHGKNPLIDKTTPLDEQVNKLRTRARQKTPLDHLLVELFALVCEASHRALGITPYTVQLLAGIGISKGHLIEMGTGEGKTLAAVAPACLYGLTGKGVHILTFNDYLARRDASWMGPVYDQLGLTVGVIQQGISSSERVKAYGCDITYLTAKEAGFDLLRDTLVLDPDKKTQRPFHVAIVDEADSILIDEARIPLVIAGQGEDALQNWKTLSEIIEVVEQDLEPEVHYKKSPDGRTVSLTDLGQQKIEKRFSTDNLYTQSNLELLANIQDALHACVLLRRDRDYIVRNQQIELIDELTGRVVEDRQWPEGLQNALEAREQVPPQKGGIILGSLTIRNLLRQYPILTGMTATATPTIEEFWDTYKLRIAVIPTHRPCIRQDLPDLIYPTKTVKEKALLDEISQVHKTGRPILVGTISVAESEALAALLTQKEITCQILNAKNDEEEAEIVANVGVLGGVTISTNMAGRGTDIRLGGADEATRDPVVDLGGLYVIGTHRHDSRRIDDQLRGRAGRQGDPGSSRFFVSLEDELLEQSGLSELFKKTETPESRSKPITSSIIRKKIKHTQRVAEGFHFELRKTLNQYSFLAEKQRTMLQCKRQKILKVEEEPILEAGCPEKYKSMLKQKVY